MDEQQHPLVAPQRAACRGRSHLRPGWAAADGLPVAGRATWTSRLCHVRGGARSEEHRDRRTRRAAGERAGGDQPWHAPGADHRWRHTGRRPAEPGGQQHDPGPTGSAHPAGRLRRARTLAPADAGLRAQRERVSRPAAGQGHAGGTTDRCDREHATPRIRARSGRMSPRGKLRRRSIQARRHCATSTPIATTISPPMYGPCPVHRIPSA